MTLFKASPSQVEKFESCVRKWGFARIDGNYAPQGKGALLGDKTHTAEERWLTARVLPDTKTPEGRMAEALIPLLPPPQKVDPNNVEIASYFELDGFIYSMKIDLWMPNASLPTVYDHKTTADFKWAKRDLLSDVQGTIYGAWALVKSGQPKARLAWNYVKSRGAPRTLKVRQVVDEQLLMPRLSKTHESMQEMEDYFKHTKKALDLPYNPLACEEFGGCYYKNICNLSAKERIKSIMARGTESRKGTDWKKKAQQTVEEDLLDTDDEETEEEEEEQPRRRKKTSTKKTSTKKKAPPPPEDDEDDEDEDEEDEEPQRHKKTRTKKKAPPPPEDDEDEDEEEDEEPEEKPTQRKKRKAPGAKGVNPPKKATTKEEDEDEDEEPEEKPKSTKRGRPKGSKNKDPFVLCVDCVPSSGQFTHVSSILAEVARLLKDGEQVDHYMLVKSGDGVGMWSEAVRTHLKAYRPEGVVVAHSTSREVKDCLQVLLDAADVAYLG